MDPYLRKRVKYGNLEKNQNNPMLSLPENPSLRDFQKYVEEMEKDRGFTDQTSVQKCLLLGEEVGELFKAVRKHEALLRMDTRSNVGTVEEELADIIIYLCAIANQHHIDLEQAFRHKEEKNKIRIWR